MKDRVPVYPGRVKLTPVSGQSNTYDMVRADAPTEEGTPLNTNTLLKGTTAELLGLIAEDSTPDDALNALYELATEGKISEDRLPTIPINKGGTGATTAEDARENLGTNNAENITAGTLNSSRLPTVPVSKGGTGATTAAAAREALQVPLAIIPEQTNIDNIIETGLYSPRAQTTDGFPFGEYSYGLLFVNHGPPNSTTDTLAQIYITHMGGVRMYFREGEYQAPATKWNEWLQVLSSPLPSTFYGTSLPAAGTPGRIFFLKA